MASNPPSTCCAAGFVHEGTPKGATSEFAGIKAYLTGDKSSKKVLLFLPDVIGPDFVNTQLVADSFATEGYYVIVADIYDGDYVPLNKGDDFDFPKWIGKHGLDQTQPTVDKLVKGIRSELKPEFLASVGYCFGARYSIRLLKGKQIDVAAAAHPSFVELDEIKAIEGPLIINAAEIDQIYPADKRAETEAALKDIGARYHTTLASGVEHGFAVRGDPKDPIQRAAKEKAFGDQVWWFSLFQ